MKTAVLLMQRMTKTTKREGLYGKYQKEPGPGNTKLLENNRIPGTDRYPGGKSGNFLKQYELVETLKKELEQLCKAGETLPANLQALPEARIPAQRIIS